LLREALRSYAGESALEIAAGNGGNLVMLTKGFEVVLGTDIVLPGMADWKALGADFLLADGASCIRLGSFDLVAFNPPYLNAEVGDDPSTEGGARLEVPMRFLKEALQVVKRTGRIVLVLNDQAQIGEFEAECRRQGFKLSRIAARHMFFEELSVYEASPI